MFNVDVVICNPPYQGRKKNIKLYPLFVAKSYELLKDQGYLAFVTPATWVRRDAQSTRRLRDMVLHNDLLQLNLSAGKWFDVGETICSFVMQKSKTNIQTDVIGEDGNHHRLDLSSEWLVHLTDDDRLFASIDDKLTKSRHPRLRWIRDISISHKDALASGDLSSTKTEEHRYLVYNTPVQKHYAKALYKTGGRLKVMGTLSGYWYSPNAPHKYLRATRALIGQGMFGVLVANHHEARCVTSYLKSKLYHFWIERNKTSGFNSGIGKLPALNNTKIWSDADVYQEFQLSADEINLIETHFRVRSRVIRRAPRAN